MSDELTRAFEAAVKKLGLASYCPSCGGLNKSSPPDIIFLDLYEEPPRCLRCGLITNRRGRAVGYLDEQGVAHVGMMRCKGGGHPVGFPE